jgi:hypothetical protein
LKLLKAIFEISENKAKSYLDGKIRLKTVNGIAKKFICLPHPGILMKRFEKNPWPEKFENEIAPVTKAEIEKLMIEIP